MIRSFAIYSKGAVCLSVKGEYPERFINFCLREQLKLWGVKRGRDCLAVWISLDDFFKIRPLVRKSKVQVRVVKRYGFWFLYKRIRQRKAFIVGAVMFFLLIYWLSGYIFFVEIQGLKKIPQQDIAVILQESGLYSGARREDIDAVKLEKKLRLCRSDIAWAGVRFNGTKALVEIVENTDRAAEKKKLGDLVAAKDGVITECIVIAGHKMVNIGDRVKAGTVLIKSEPGSIAEGIIKAQIDYVCYGQAALKKPVYHRTGKQDFSVTVKLNNHTYDLKKVDLENFLVYEEAFLGKNGWQWRNQWFAVELVLGIYKELSVNVIDYTPEEAKQLAILAAMAESKDLVAEDAQMLQREVELIPDDVNDSVKVKLQIKTEEDIGKYINMAGSDEMTVLPETDT